MIVERIGGYESTKVWIRWRDENNKVKTIVDDNWKPFGFLETKDAKYVNALAKEDGYKGVYGEDLTKVTMSAPHQVGSLKNRFEKTWECNVPWVDRVLSQRLKARLAPIPNYNHRIWYWDMEWDSDTEMITVISIYDSYNENMLLWYLKNEAHDPIDDEGVFAPHNHVYTYSFDSESSMLIHFVETLNTFDPDILTGWNVVNADTRVLIERLQANGLDPKDLCPRGIKRITHDWSDWAQPIGGRLVVDLMLCATKLWQIKNGALPDKKLDTVARIMLNESKVDLPDGHNSYYTDINKYLEYNLIDTRLLVDIDHAVNAINHHLAIQHIVQCSFRATPFVTKLFTIMAINDPLFDLQIPSRAQFEYVPYSGASIMDPRPGRYEKVAIMDIKAMYHSNVNLHNISWETLCSGVLVGKDCGNGSRFAQGQRGLLGRQMDLMTNLRNKYKEKMRRATDERERRRWDAMQFATKSLVASMYGAAGDSKYGLYHPEVAAAITYTSRQTLFRLQEECGKHGMSVIYGHTDSVFVTCDGIEHAERALEQINKDLDPIITEFEKYCMSMVIVAKNRYAGAVTYTDGVIHDPELYVKGIEMKQSRLPPIMKQVMAKTIWAVLRGHDGGHLMGYLEGMIKDILSGQIPETDLCIQARLSKDLHDYKVLGESRRGAAWANRVLGKGYRKGSSFLSAIDASGEYIAFDDPSDIEGITNIGKEMMIDKFIVDKVRPYFELMSWDIQPLLNARNGISDVGWL